MKDFVLTTKSESELVTVAKQLAVLTETEKLFLFDAKMGLGKTTLIRLIARELGIVDVVNSPTYSIVNEYRMPNEDFFYHFDLYRLSPEELFDIGFEDYFSNNNLIFIEWPEIGRDFYPTKFVEIKISRNDELHVYEISRIDS